MAGNNKKTCSGNRSLLDEISSVVLFWHDYGFIVRLMMNISKNCDSFPIEMNFSFADGLDFFGKFLRL
jgi:hypothetical protein